MVGGQRAMCSDVCGVRSGSAGTAEGSGRAAAVAAAAAAAAGTD